jgi:pimeloyl-ACP methyl ester carboxylesterase
MPSSDKKEDAMGEYIDIGGVKTWYDMAGTGEPLVLMHGGLCTNDTWGPVLPELAERFTVFAPERRGHGHTPDVDGPLHYSDMAADTIAFIETVVKGPAHLVGWSDGGIVALLVAIERPDLVRKVVPISANLNTRDVVPGAHDALPEDANHPGMEMFRGLHAASSPDGADHWQVFFTKMRTMITTEPDISLDEVARIQAPTLIVSSDDDIPTLEHSIAIYRAIPTSELFVVPGTSHALVMEKPNLVDQVILDFLANDAQPTRMPFRRATVPAA